MKEIKDETRQNGGKSRCWLIVRRFWGEKCSSVAGKRKGKGNKEVLQGLMPIL